MTRADRREMVQSTALAILAAIIAGVIVGSVYTLVARPLAPYAPVALDGWWLPLAVGFCGVAIGFGVSHERIRLALGLVVIVALVGAAVFSLMLSLPSFTSYSTNAVGLINYALTQGTLCCFVLLVIAFPAVMVGLLISAWWADR